MTDKRLPQEEQELSRGLARYLEQEGWTVELEPVVELYRPDLLVTAPSGRVYVLELKTGQKPVHFGAVAQVAAYRTAFRHVDAEPVLLITGETSPALDNLARAMDVVVSVESPHQPGEDISEGFGRTLLSLESSHPK